MNLDDFGYRRVDLLIYTSGGQTANIARKLLARKEVVFVGASIGEPTIDLRAEVVIKDSEQLLDLLETVRALPNVNRVIWSEIVKILGRRSSVPDLIIDQL